MRVLVVEDERVLADAIATGLRREALAVDVAYDGAGALERAGINDYDVIVLDRDLPKVHGDEVCKQLVAQRYPARIIMLTAAGELDDKVEGLSIGADDYLAKPFEPKELLLRIEAILRRAGDKPVAQDKLTFGASTFDLERGELFHDGVLVHLTEAESQLLKRLAANAHTPVDRLELARDTADASGRAVDIQVTRLRRKIEQDPKTPRYLQTVRGVGYMLAPD